MISCSVSVILTHYFGDDFAYDDTVEERFGLKARHFTSFNAAAKEAAISRFYGGIHFMDAIDEGMVQGDKVGNWETGRKSSYLKLEIVFKARQSGKMNWYGLLP